MTTVKAKVCLSKNASGSPVTLVLWTTELEALFGNAESLLQPDNLFYQKFDTPVAVRLDGKGGAMLVSTPEQTLGKIAWPSLKWTEISVEL